MIWTVMALALLSASIAAAFAMSRRWGWSSPGRKPHARHWITRTICAVIGLGIAIAITVGTIRDARRPYADAPQVRFRLPTLPPPESPKELVPLKKGRFLVYVALANKLEGSLFPVHGETFEVRWPEDCGRKFGSVEDRIGSSSWPEKLPPRSDIR